MASHLTWHIRELLSSGEYKHEKKPSEHIQLLLWLFVTVVAVMKAGDLFFTCMIGKLKRGRDESLWDQEFLPRIWNKLLGSETFSLENESWIWNAHIFCLLMHQILPITYTCELVTKGLVLTLVVISNGVERFTGETRDYTNLRVLNRMCPNSPCHSSFHPVQFDSCHSKRPL